MESIAKKILKNILFRVKRLNALLSLRVLRRITFHGCCNIGQLYRQYDFNPVLWENPSLLYGFVSSINDTKSTNIIHRWLLRCVMIGVRSNVLLNQKARHTMIGLGMPSFFSNEPENLLNGGWRKYVRYNVPQCDEEYSKIAVYTVITGDYDNTNEILHKTPGVDYYLITNNASVKSNTWIVQYVESELSNLLLSREIKMFPWKYLPDNYDTSIYIDANALIYGNLIQLTNYLSDNVSFAVTKHCARNTVRDEIDACVRLKGIDEQAALIQFEKYIDDGFQDNMGLAECTILVRRHTENVRKLMEMWYREFVNGIHRDQISLLPCIHMSGFDEFKLIDGCVWNNQFCIIGPHASL